MPKTPAALASASADSIRSLNHATFSTRPGWEYPGDAYSTIGSLSQMAMMLPQALEQITRLIADLNEGGHLRSDRNTLQHDLGETFYGLDDARIAAEKLYGSLNRAHAATSHLGWKE